MLRRRSLPLLVITGLALAAWSGPALSATLAEGSLDPAFGNGGVAALSWSPADLAAGPDGTLVGVANAYGGPGPDQAFLFRLGRDGAFDTTFDGGFVQLDPDGSSDRLLAVDVLPGGEVVAVGQEGLVAWVDATGRGIDGFGTGGITRVDSVDGREDVVSVVADGADGVLLLLSRPSDSVVVRLKRSGDVDYAYGTGGIAPIDASWLRAGPDGTVVGAWPDSYRGLVVTRLLRTGLPDPTFGAGGTTLIPAPYGGWGGIDVDNAGAVFAARSTGMFDEDGIGTSVFKLRADGTLDPSYGSDGRSAIPTPAGARLGLDLSGRVVLVGRVPPPACCEQTHSIYWARLRRDGALDAEFGTAGFASVACTACASTYNVGSLGQRRIVGVGDSIAFPMPWDVGPIFRARSTRLPVPLRLIGTARADALTGGTLADVIIGASGDDQLRGAAGNDRIWGGWGDDLVVAGAGDDLLHGDGGSDTLVGGAGRDVLVGDAGNDRLVSVDDSADRVLCGAARDVAVVDRRDVAFACETVLVRAVASAGSSA